MALKSSRSLRSLIQRRSRALLFVVATLWFVLFIVNRIRRSQIKTTTLLDYPDSFNYDYPPNSGMDDTGIGIEDPGYTYEYEYYDYDTGKEILFRDSIGSANDTEATPTKIAITITNIQDSVNRGTQEIKAETAKHVESAERKLPALTVVKQDETEEYDGRYEIPTPEVILNISEDPDFERKLDFFQTEPIPFLPNYRTPCWFENVTNEDSYFQNFFLLATERSLRFLESYRNMRTIIESRKTQNKHVAWRLRCLPAYYIAGFSKCGSTDLSIALDMHPEVIKGDMKELKYWNRVRHPHRIQRYQQAAETHKHLNDFPRRINHFLEALDFSAEKSRSHRLPPLDINDPPLHPLLIGDSTPSYLWDFDSWVSMELNKGLDEPKYIVAHYIRHVTPNAKIVLIVRNPTDRLYSDFKGFQRQQQKSKEIFHEKCERGIAIFEECVKKRSLRACLYDFDVNNDADVLPVRVRVGIYYQVLKDWFEVFPREQFYITRLEHYAVYRRQTISEVVQFLGLREMPEEIFQRIEDFGIRNQATRKMNERVGGNMMNKTREMLNNFYKPYNQKLAELMKDKNYAWLS